MADARIKLEGDASQLIAEVRRLRGEMGGVREQVARTGREGQQANRTMIQGMGTLATKALAAAAAVKAIADGVASVTSEINDATTKGVDFEKALRKTAASTQMSVAELRNMATSTKYLDDKGSLAAIEAARRGAPTLGAGGIRSALQAADLAEASGIDPTQVAGLAAAFRASGVEDAGSVAAFVASRGGPRAVERLMQVSRTRSLRKQGALSDRVIAQVTAQGAAGAEIPSVGASVGQLYPTATGDLASQAAARMANVGAVRSFRLAEAASAAGDDPIADASRRVEVARLRQVRAQRQNRAATAREAARQEIVADWAESDSLMWWIRNTARDMGGGVGEGISDAAELSMAPAGREVPRVTRGDSHVLRPLEKIEQNTRDLSASMKGAGISVRGGP